MWGRRTEQSRGLDDRLIENAEERGRGASKAGQDYGAACRMDVQAVYAMLDAAWLFVVVPARLSGGLLSNRPGERRWHRIAIRGFKGVTGGRYVDLQAATKIHTYMIVIQTLGRWTEARQAKPGTQNKVILIGIIAGDDCMRSGRELQAWEVLAPNRLFMSFTIAIIATYRIDAHVAVRAKCRPRLAVKRWRLAPTHPLQPTSRSNCCDLSVRPNRLGHPQAIIVLSMRFDARTHVCRGLPEPHKRGCCYDCLSHPPVRSCSG